MHLHIASFVLLALTGSVTVLADGLNGRQPIFVSEVGIRTPLSSFVGDESSGGVSSRSSIQSTEEDEKRYLLNIRSNVRARTQFRCFRSSLPYLHLLSWASSLPLPYLPHGPAHFLFQPFTTLTFLLYMKGS